MRYKSKHPLGQWAKDLLVNSEPESEDSLQSYSDRLSLKNTEELHSQYRKQAEKLINGN
jgi:hypothetical protein